MFWITLLNSVTYALDTILYTMAVMVSSYLPEAADRWVVRQLFTMNKMGAMERGDCIYLMNRCTAVDEKLLFDEKPERVTCNVSEAVEMARETGLPIQTIVNYYSKEYFRADLVYPQPYELVYEFGEVSVKEEKEYDRYFFERLASRPSVRLYEPSYDHSLLVFVSLLCSRFSAAVMYTMLRYQWYNKVCFRGFLILATVSVLILG